METDALMHTAILLVIGVICLAGFAQGLSGFGFGLITMPLLPLFMGVKDAVTLTVLLNLVVCGTTFLSIHYHYSWRQGLGLLVGALLGVPAGVYVLIHMNQTLLLRILGGVMLSFAINELWLTRAKPVRLSSRLALPFGLVSGGLSGAFNMGGPPAIVFCYSQTWSKEQIVALLQIVFGLSTCLRLVLLGSAGYLKKTLLLAGLWSLAPLIGAILLGQQLFARVSQNTLKKAVFLFLGAMGIRYLVFP
jgi:uncharacterized protein